MKNKEKQFTTIKENLERTSKLTKIIGGICIFFLVLLTTLSLTSMLTEDRESIVENTTLVSYLTTITKKPKSEIMNIKNFKSRSLITSVTLNSINILVLLIMIIIIISKINKMFKVSPKLKDFLTKENLIKFNFSLTPFMVILFINVFIIDLPIGLIFFVFTTILYEIITFLFSYILEDKK